MVAAVAAARPLAVVKNVAATVTLATAMEPVMASQAAQKTWSLPQYYCAPLLLWIRGVDNKKTPNLQRHTQKSDFMQSRFNYHLFRLRWQTKVKISPNSEATTGLVSLVSPPNETNLFLLRSWCQYCWANALNQPTCAGRVNLCFGDDCLH